MTNSRDTCGSGDRTPQAGNPHQSDTKTASSSPPTEDFPLLATGDLPDPKTHAWRSDLADVALAGRVVVSHYARPVARKLKRAAKLRAEADDASPILLELSDGAPYDLLDSRGEWAWGYGGEERLVGYIKVEALA